MDLGDQGTGGIHDAQVALFAGLAHLGRNTMSAVDDTLTVRDLFHAVHENSALALEFIHHIAVVDDLFTDVNRRAEGLKGYTNNVNSSNHTGAEPSGFEQDKRLGCRLHFGLGFDLYAHGLGFKYTRVA